jgi:hypothetical protein
MRSTPIAASFLAVAVTASICWTARAFAVSHTFAQFSVVAQDTNSIQSVPLTGATAGTVFNGYTVGFDWTPGMNLPFSHEASMAFVSAPPPQTPAHVFYADPGAAPNSKFDGNPIHLSWGGLLDDNYTGGDPLHFWYVQSFGGSNASWSNIDVTLYSFTPAVSGFAGNTSGQPTWRRPNTTSALSNTGTAVPYQAVPFSVDATGPYVIKTVAGGYDGYLGIYAGSFSATDQLTNILALNDDGPTGGSEVSVALDAGQTYYLVQSGFANGDFGPWTATFSGTGIASVIPEPAIAGVALLGALGRCFRFVRGGASRALRNA